MEETNPVKLAPGAQCEIWRLRILEVDSAFVYTVFESHEGVLAYSTVSSTVSSNEGLNPEKSRPRDGTSELELIVPTLRREEALFILKKLKADVDSLIMLQGPEI